MKGNNLFLKLVTADDLDALIGNVTSDILKREEPQSSIVQIGESRILRAALEPGGSYLFDPASRIIMYPKLADLLTKTGSIKKKLLLEEFHGSCMYHELGCHLSNAVKYFNIYGPLTLDLCRLNLAYMMGYEVKPVLTFLASMVKKSLLDTVFIEEGVATLSQVSFLWERKRILESTYGAKLGLERVIEEIENLEDLEITNCHEFCPPEYRPLVGLRLIDLVKEKYGETNFSWIKEYLYNVSGEGLLPHGDKYEPTAFSVSPNIMLLIIIYDIDENEARELKGDIRLLRALFMEKLRKRAPVIGEYDRMRVRVSGLDTSPLKAFFRRKKIMERSPAPEDLLAGALIDAMLGTVVVCEYDDAGQYMKMTPYIFRRIYDNTPINRNKVLKIISGLCELNSQVGIPLVKSAKLLSPPCFSQGRCKPEELVKTRFITMTHDDAVIEHLEDRRSHLQREYGWLIKSLRELLKEDGKSGR